MSDYISKNALIDFIMRNVVTLTEEAHDFKVEIIDAIKNQPTVDEKEIIRKPMERIIERLEKKSWKSYSDVARRNLLHLDDAIEICKEEGGIE